MPNCFQLYPKGSNDAATLQDVDAKMCQHFAQPCHPKYWLHDWYHVIGFLIACKDGCHLGTDKLRAEVIAWYQPDRTAEVADALLILDWLEANYTSNAWAEIGRHRPRPDDDATTGAHAELDD